MPTVPTYQPGQVRQTVAPTPQVSADSFGAAQAQALGGAAQSGLSMGRELINDAASQQEMVNRDQVRQALSDYQNDAMDYVAQNVLPKKGQDGMNVLPDAQTQFTQLRDNYTQNLQNPAQQAMFNQLVPTVYNRASNMVRRHQSEQTQVFHNQTFQAENDSDTNAAVMDYNDPSKIATAEQTITANNGAMYAGTPAEGAAKTAADISNLHSSIVKAMVQNDPAQAAVYLRQNQAKILPKDFETLNKSVTDQLATVGANQTASTLSQLNPTDAMAATNKIADPVQRQLTIDTLKTHFNAQTSQAALATADNDAANARGVLTNPAQAPALIPQNTAPAQRQQLLDAANARVAAQQNNQPIQTNLDVYSSLVNQAKSDPDGFLRRPLSPYLNQLSDADANNILTLRDDLANKRDGARDKAFSLDSMNKMFMDGVRGAPELSTQDPRTGKEMPPGPALQQRMQDISAFRDDFTNRVNSQLPDPAQRTPENAQKILDQMLTRRVVQKGWFSNTTAPQGMIDENPTLDHTTGQWNKTLEPGTFNGQPAYLDYNSDRTSATIYGKDGKLIGTWPK